MIDAVSTAGSSGIALSDVDREYRRHRRSVFAGIFAGYAAYYLVRNNLALAIPDILAAHPVNKATRARRFPSAGSNSGSLP